MLRRCLETFKFKKEFETSSHVREARFYLSSEPSDSTGHSSINRKETNPGIIGCGHDYFILFGEMFSFGYETEDFANALKRSTFPFPTRKHKVDGPLDPFASFPETV